jgi:hypothetical protein
MLIKFEANLCIYHPIDILIEKHLALKVFLLNLHPSLLHIGDISNHLISHFLKDFRSRPWVKSYIERAETRVLGEAV